jgi:hypothetical protein
MGTGTRAFVVIGMVLVSPGRSHADEADNFTCRNRVLRDSLGAVDVVMNARIRQVVERANRLDDASCDAPCLFRQLIDGIGASYRHPVTGISHSRFEKWIDERSDIDRCHLAFRGSIYGARPYNQPWLLPFNGRIIFLADSILVSGRVVGIDKFNHFIREGLAHWRDVRQPGGEIAAVMARELGSPGRQWRWNEHGLKGLSLTGVLSYADLAASYSGFRFWSDLLSIGQPGSFVAYDGSVGHFVQRRRFSFAEYVNDAWDEGVNCSAFHPVLARQVTAALRRRAMSCPVTDCRLLAGLPQADLYVNPMCVPAAARRPSTTTGTNRFRSGMSG